MIYTIENNFLKAKISSLGCTLMSLIDKESGTDLVLGFDDEKDYLACSDPHFGSTVGRNANRIAKGQFEIDGVKYQLSINNGPNNLHSGVSDLSFRGYELLDHTSLYVSFGLTDNDMSGGFPGNLKVKVTYSLNGNSLIETFDGISDKKTIFNFTNHSYFNLSGGKKDILNHTLLINTDKVSLNDSDGMATDKIINVNNTVFDFRKFHKIGVNINKKHPNLANGGLDHNYVFESLKDKEMARLKYQKTELIVSSDLPDMHVYTACSLKEVIGKDNMIYKKFQGIALECDFYPNGINYDGIISPVIEANSEVSHHIKYTINKG